MQVRELMDHQASLCRLEDTLDVVIRRMMDSGAPLLPVVDPARSLVGTISERDICIALHLEDASPSRVTVGEAMNSRRPSCDSDDRAEDALRIMRRFRIRCLPVTDRSGRVLGMVDGNDLEIALQHEDEVFVSDYGVPGSSARPTPRIRRMSA
jgi:CBS domain-containing protein